MEKKIRGQKKRGENVEEDIFFVSLAKFVCTIYE